jgi:SulP family sulfate permease
LKLIHGLNFKNIKGDLLGGVTAAVVALPLAIAFGETALGDGGAIYGMYGAIIVGFLAALFGGTPSQVSGPTGPMSMAVQGLCGAFVISNSLGEPIKNVPIEQMILLICGAIILGGLFQILFGLLKLGKYITLVPYSVVSGFMSGIGFIIIITELGNLLGIGKVKGTWNSLLLVANQLTSKVNIVDGSGLFGGEIVEKITQINGAAIGVSLMTIAIVFITPKKITNIIPSPLLALLIVAPLSVFLFNDDKLLSLGKDALPRIGDIPTGFPTLLPFKDALTDPVIVSNLQNNLNAIVQGGIVLAALGAIDSLLTSLVADNITQTRHDSNRELIGQGIGNAVGGFFGGLPGAGATMRTVINVKSGGKTPISGMTHSIILLFVLVAFGPYAAVIPKSLLAAILLKVGLDIIDWRFLFRAHKLSIKTAAVMYGVLLLTVFYSLIWAVLIGVFVANMLTIDSITETQLEGMDEDNPLSNDDQAKNALPADEKALLDRCSGEVMLFRLKGPLSFGAAKGITDRMALVQNYKVLILDITEVPRLGVTASLALEDMMLEAKNNSKKAFVAGANEKVKERLSKFGIDGVIVETRKEALLSALDEIKK